MLKATCGSLHLDSDQFFPLSRGKLSALLYSEKIQVESWTQGDIDQIICYGDELFTKQFQNGRFPNTSSALVKYLPVVTNSIDDYMYTVTYNNSYSRYVTEITSAGSLFSFAFEDAMLQAFTSCSSAILSIGHSR